MRVASRSALWCVVLSLVCTLAWAAEPEIVFVDDARLGAKSIMVMDADGTNRTEVFRTAKRYEDGIGGPWLSPSISPDGLWVAFVYEEGDEGPGWAIWKSATAGGAPQLLLCSSGTDGLVVLETPQWSPDGTEIAAVRREFAAGLQSIVIIPEEGIDCGVEQPEVVYSSPVGDISLGVAWSPDGANLAFLESNDLGVDFLTVAPRESGGATSYQIVWPAEFLDGLIYKEPHALDWQRSGSLLFALDTYSESTTGSLDNVWMLQVTGSTAYAVSIAQGQSPTWAPDDSQLLWGGPQGLTRVTFPGGGTESLGSGEGPDWKRSPLAVCGDGACEGGESQCSCPADCGAYPSTEAEACADFVDNDCDAYVDCDDPDCADDPVCVVPFCGDGFCDVDEDRCTCPEDCGNPLGSEAGSCSDRIDNDCDLNADCADSDCATDPACSCLAKGETCTSNAECCSGLCHPVKLTCK